MRSRFYTVLVVPHQGRTSRTFVISRRFAFTLGLMVTLLGAAGIFFPGLWLSARAQEETITSVRARNQVLSTSLGEVDAQLVSLRERMEFYEQEARKLALLAGLEPLDALQATGGAPAVDDALAGDIPPGVRGMLEELESLTVREERLTHNFAELAIGYEKLESDLAAIPSISPVPQGYLGSSYGWRKDPFTGRRVFHQGQDIIASTGTPIQAPAEGKVTRAARRGGLGLSVSVSHGNGLVTRYGHLSRIKVKVGQKVARGDTLGLVGSTGRSLGSHLHYEVFKYGKQIDPKDFILQEPAAPTS